MILNANENIKASGITGAFIFATINIFMRINKIYLIVVLVAVNDSFGQNLTRKFVDNWVLSKDSNFKWEENTVYSIKDKNYYFKKNDNIDSAISTIRMADLVDLKYMIPTLKPNSPMFYIIIIETKHEMAASNIEARIQKTRFYLLDKKLSDSFDVVLNDSLVAPAKRLDLINTLEISAVYSIDLLRPNRFSYFGDRLKKYQIRIWTKQ